jgi:hypothetical protein
MSEEEIIEYIKGYLELDGDFISERTYKAIAGLLDLYNKQKEEIEYYKDELEKESSIWTKIEKGNDFISKDKIRDKINELVEEQKTLTNLEKINWQIEVLNELLEE